MRPRPGRALAAGALLACGLVPAARAETCLMDHAAYAESRSVATLEFRPTGQGAATTNTFRLKLPALALDGVVLWTDPVSRPNGMVMFNCPAGDATGEELNACIVWQGVIYSADGKGAIGLLPGEHEPAPAMLILPDLGPQLAQSGAFSQSGAAGAPWDVFTLKGCNG